MNTNTQTQQANEELNRQCRDAAEKLGKIMERLNNRAAEWITSWVKEDMPCIHEEVSHDDGWIYFFRDGTDPGNEGWEWILELAGSEDHDIKGPVVLPGRGWQHRFKKVLESELCQLFPTNPDWWVHRLQETAETILREDHEEYEDDEDDGDREKEEIGIRALKRVLEGMTEGNRTYHFDCALCRDFDRDRCRFDLFEALADADSEAQNL